MPFQPFQVVPQGPSKLTSKNNLYYKDHKYEFLCETQIATLNAMEDPLIFKKMSTLAMGCRFIPIN